MWVRKVLTFLRSGISFTEIFILMAVQAYRPQYIYPFRELDKSYTTDHSCGFHKLLFDSSYLSPFYVKEDGGVPVPET